MQNIINNNVFEKKIVTSSTSIKIQENYTYLIIYDQLSKIIEASYW